MGNYKEVQDKEPEIIKNADQDSDSLYVTNQSDIVNCAKHCYNNYPTIVNNIPKEKNKYDYSLDNYAVIDNNLAAAQRAIGESSNLAQLCLTYTYNFPNEKKYQDYVCILSVLAQVAIDNAKRRFDIDLNKEIKFIKDDMDILKNKYPSFWSLIRKDFSKARINKDLKCPMNSIYEKKTPRIQVTSSTLPMSYFFVRHEPDKDRRKSKIVEELIQKYSLKVYDYYKVSEHSQEQNLLLRDDFDKLLSDISKVYISKNYAGLMSWLINRAFIITPEIKSNIKSVSSTMNANKSLLLKTLYNINPNSFLSCFR